MDFQQDVNKAGEKFQLILNVNGDNAMLGNDGTDYAAALVLMTDWELWVTGQSYVDQFDPNTEDTGWNEPLSLQFKDVYQNTRFMTYIPMTNAGSINGDT